MAPAFRPYKIVPGQHIEIVIQQANGGRALVVGTVDRVPHLAGDTVQRMEVTAALISSLKAR